MSPLRCRRIDHRVCSPVLRSLVWGALAGALFLHTACSPLDNDDGRAAQAAGFAGTSTAARVVMPAPPKPTPPALPVAAPTRPGNNIRPTWSVVPLVASQAEGEQGLPAVTQTATTLGAVSSQRVLKSLPTATEPALPSVPTALPASPAEQAALLTRPPIAPPITPLYPPEVSNTDKDKQSARRCVEAVNAARTVVERPLGLPVEQLKNPDWKEDGLRATELAQIACRGETGEQAAQYWRATAFLFHGQYARAAVNYRRVIELPGAYANWGYVQNLALMLDHCARADRDALDAWTLGGLLEARGAASDARLLYTRSVEARCAPLRSWSKARIAVVDG